MGRTAASVDVDCRTSSLGPRTRAALVDVVRALPVRASNSVRDFCVLHPVATRCRRAVAANWTGPILNSANGARWRQD
jgi:hypothetical protein